MRPLHLNIFIVTFHINYYYKITPNLKLISKEMIINQLAKKHDIE